MCRWFDSRWYHLKDSRLQQCRQLFRFHPAHNSGTNTGNLSFSNALFSHRFFSKAYLSFPPRSSSLRSLLRRRRHSFHTIKTPRLNTMSITTLFKSYAPFGRQSLIVWKFNVSQEYVLRVSDFRTLFWHRPNHLFHATRHHRIL